MNMQILVLTELLYLKNTEIVHGDSFGVEHVPEEFKEFVGNKKIKANIFKIQLKNSILCRHFSLDSLILCLLVKFD